MSWEIHVYDSSGAKKAVITPEDPVLEVHWAVRGDGDCLDGMIAGRGLPITTRDIVAIHAPSTPNGTGWAVRYWGWCVAAPADRAPGIGEWRFVGGSTRLREIISRRLRIVGGDIASMARSATLDDNSAPQARVGLVARASDFPTIGFSAGSRHPNLETIAASLDALAELVPAFTATSTYDYDGRTYQPGDVVPAATWGVKGGQATPPASIAYDPDNPGAYDGGRIFFRRIDGQLQLIEVTDRLEIEWGQSIAEAVVDSVVVAIATAPTQGAIEIRATPLSPTSPYEPVAYVLEDALGLKLDAWKLVEAPDLDTLEAASWLAAVDAAGMSNPGNPFDGSAGTYASNQLGTQFYLRRQAEPDARVMRVRYSSFIDLFAIFQYHHAGGGGSGQFTYRWPLASTNGQQRDVWLVAPRLQGAAPDVRVGIFYTSPPFDFTEPPVVEADQTRIYLLEALKPNTTVLDAMARSQLRRPTPAIATVRVPGRLLDPLPNIRIELAGGALHTGSVGSAEMSITGRAGFSTLLRLEEPLPPELAAEREAFKRVTERLYTRTGLAGGRRL